MTTNHPKSHATHLPDIKIGTWNVQGGLQNPHLTTHLIHDLHRLKGDIVCLQETHCPDLLKTTDLGTIICIAPPPTDNIPIHQQYGQGFYISPRMLPYYWGYKYIGHRISVINFKLNSQTAQESNKTKTRPHRSRGYIMLSIINAYAPTSVTTRQDPLLTQSFYDTLAATYKEYKTKSYITIIAGDFNAKLGLRQTTHETFMGAHGKGTRNSNGHNLAEFLQNNTLYATNTTFEHPMKHRSTWHGYIASAHRYNQIDYVLASQRLVHDHPRILRNSRSYSPSQFTSDHKIVLTTFHFKNIYISHAKRIRPPLLPFDVSTLAENKEIQNQFQAKIHESLPNVDLSNASSVHPYTNITETLQKIATELFPRKPAPLAAYRHLPNDPTLTRYIKQRGNLSRMLKLKKYKGRRRTKLQKKKGYR
jgi:exonuclease III